MTSNPTIDLELFGRQTKNTNQKARICFNSLSASFASECVYCDSLLYTNTVSRISIVRQFVRLSSNFKLTHSLSHLLSQQLKLTACTGSPTLANNITQAQAFCIATACLEVPVLRNLSAQPKVAETRFRQTRSTNTRRFSSPKTTTKPLVDSSLSNTADQLPVVVGVRLPRQEVVELPLDPTGLGQATASTDTLEAEMTTEPPGVAVQQEPPKTTMQTEMTKSKVTNEQSARPVPNYPNFSKMHSQIYAHNSEWKPLLGLRHWSLFGGRHRPAIINSQGRQPPHRPATLAESIYSGLASKKANLHNFWHRLGGGKFQREKPTASLFTAADQFSHRHY